MKVAIYTRVSTQQQTVQNQLLELYEVCERNNWTVVEEYSEGVYIEDVFSSHQSVTRVRRKAENIIFNVSKGIFPSQKV